MLQELIKRDLYYPGIRNFNRTIKEDDLDDEYLISFIGFSKNLILSRSEPDMVCHFHNQAGFSKIGKMEHFGSSSTFGNVYV